MKLFNVTTTETHQFYTSQEFDDYLTTIDHQNTIITREGERIRTFLESEEVCFLFSNEKKLYIKENQVNESVKTEKVNNDFGVDIHQHVEHLRRKENYFKQVQSVFFKRFDNCKKMKELQDYQYNSLKALNLYVNSLKTEQENESKTTKQLVAESKKFVDELELEKTIFELKSTPIDIPLKNKKAKNLFELIELKDAEKFFRETKERIIKQDLMLKQICCEIYPSFENINFKNMIETNISKAMALKEEEKKILSPFLENMMNFENELKKVSDFTIDEEEKIENLISELTNIDVTLSLIDSDMKEIEKEFVEKKNAFTAEFIIYWEKLMQIKSKIENNSRSIKMHKDLANSIHNSHLYKQLKLANHLKEDYTSILVEIQRRKAFQEEFLKLLNNFDLNRIIKEENETRSKLISNGILPHDLISGFQNKIPLVDYSSFNVDQELPSFNLEDKNWMVVPMTESLFEEKKVKKISDSFDLTGSSISVFGSSIFLDNLSSFQVPQESIEKNEQSTSSIESESVDQEQKVIEETKSEDEIFEKLTPTEEVLEDLQQLQIDELLKKNQELEETNHVVEKHVQKLKTKVAKFEEENDSLMKQLKSKEQFNNILDKELNEKQLTIERLTKQNDVQMNEISELNETVNIFNQTKNELKKKLQSTEKLNVEIVDVNIDQSSKIKKLQEKIEDLQKSQQIQKITEEDISKLKTKYDEEIVKLNELIDTERMKSGIELSKYEIEMKKLKNENEFIKTKLTAQTKDFVAEIQNFDDFKRYSEKTVTNLKEEIIEKERKIGELNKFIAHITDLLAQYAKKK
eukprot:gene6653-10818_t